MKQCLELQVFSILQFGETSRRELATTEFLTTATIAITVLSDHGSGGWRKATQTGATVANTHGCRAFSKAVNLTSIARGAASPRSSGDIPLEGGVVLREPHVPLQHEVPIHQPQAGHLIHQPTQCSLAGLSGRVGVTFPP